MTRCHDRLGSVLTVVTFGLSLAFSYGPGALRMTLPYALVVSLAASGCVWLSGRRPIAALAAVSVMTVGLPAIGSTFEAMDLVVVLVLFRAATDTALRPWILAVTGLSVLTLDDVWQRIAFDRGFAEPSVAYPLLLTALSVGLGLQSRRVRRQHDELVALRDADRRRAVSDERRRIARDVHDVAAHHLTALVVRNKLALRRGSEPALSDAAQFTAETAGAALDALRQVVQVLNTEGESPLTPVPGLADVDRVVARMEAAGLRVECAVDPPPVVSDEAAQAVVRIVAEALSNVLRHRGPGRCWLAVTGHGDTVAVVVDDDGRGPPPDPDGVRPGGYGLIGMRERAQACGGSLEVGPSPRGGWRVSAVMRASRA